MAYLKKPTARERFESERNPRHTAKRVPPAKRVCFLLVILKNFSLANFITGTGASVTYLYTRGAISSINPKLDL